MADAYDIDEPVELVATFGDTVNIDDLTFTVYDPDGAETTPTPETEDNLTFTAITIPDAGGVWLWRAVANDLAAESGQFYVRLSPRDAFASVDDVQARMGRTLTDDERSLAAYLLAGAAGLIADAAGKPDDWIATVTSPPRALRTVSVEAVVRVMHNPTGATSSSITLGDYSRSSGFTGSTVDGGLALTDREERKVRRAIYGQNIASPRVGSVLDDIYPSCGS